MRKPAVVTFAVVVVGVLATFLLSNNPVTAQEKNTSGLQRNEIVLYEHDGFKETGRIKKIIVTDMDVGKKHSLHIIDFKDCLSSLKWNLDPGIVVTFYEDERGDGRQYQISGAGEDTNTADNNFKDCASSYDWSKTESKPESK